jgi:hypothetical protein
VTVFSPTPSLVHRPPCAPTTRRSDRNFWNRTFRNLIELLACLPTTGWSDHNFLVNDWSVDKGGGYLCLAGPWVWCATCFPHRSSKCWRSKSPSSPLNVWAVSCHYPCGARGPPSFWCNASNVKSLGPIVDYAFRQTFVSATAPGEFWLKWGVNLHLGDDMTNSVLFFYDRTP